MTRRDDLQVADLVAGYDSDSWAGWGYLGERKSAMDRALELDRPERDVAVAAIHAADVAVLDAANLCGLTVDELFAWANSRSGRHFADQALYSAEGIARGFSWNIGPGQAGLDRRSR